jgi:predicted Zn-dependent peptidase
MHSVDFLRLENGLRVATVACPGLHRAVIVAGARVGARDETARTNGLSHLLEHALFRGTRSWPSAQSLNRHVEVFGGTLGAATTCNETSFELSFPPRALRKAAGVFRELFSSPAMADLEIEKKIVREETLEELDENGRWIAADGLSRRLVFGRHPLGLPLTGTRANIDRFTERDLRRHFARHYLAGNMAAVIAGPFSRRRMASAARLGFGAIPAGTVPRPAPFVAGQQRARTCFIEHDTGQSSLAIAFAASGQQQGDTRALTLLMRVLDDGMSTRLHRRLCDELGLAYEVSAMTEILPDVSYVEVWARVATGSAVAVVGEVLSLLADLAVSGPTGEEVVQARLRHVCSLDGDEDVPSDLASHYLLGELADLRQTIGECRQHVLTLGAEDLHRIAREVFDPAHACVTVVGQVDSRTRQGISGHLRRFRQRIRRANLRQGPTK